MRDIFRGIFGQGKDQAKPKEVSGGKTIEIGGSNYILSSEAEKFIRRVQYSEYPKSKSVLILEEPHYDFEAQKNLYGFLQVFFKDNPTLVSKTIFLSEGYPANQTVDLNPLIREEPNPSDDLIGEVLNTFLITGYMAYEWKYKRGIPIIGTEDEVLHQFSGKLWSDINDETSPLWKLSVVLRNRKMMSVLKSKIGIFENPVLFVGGMHINEHMSRKDMDDIIDHNLGNTLTQDEKDHLVQGDNLGVYDYLELERVGFNFVSFRGEIGDRYVEMYRKLFQAQEGNEYEGYIKWYMKETGLGVTTRPSPEAAADFVRVFKKNPPQNSDSRKANERGLSLTSQGKYAEAAAEFSAASAIEPKIPGYVVSTQEALFKESEARILSVTRATDKPFRIKPGIKYDLPVFGPYIEKDHYDQISQFAKDFTRVAGVQEVINKAMSRYWEIRFGGIFQIKTASRLEQENIRAFEERHTLRLKGLKGGKVEIRPDIVTKDNIVVECKNIAPNRLPTPGNVLDWTEQVTYRFEPDERGHTFKSVLIVVPDEKDIQEIQRMVDGYLRVYYPELLTKVKACRLSEVKEEYDIMRKR